MICTLEEDPSEQGVSMPKHGDTKVGVGEHLTFSQRRAVEKLLTARRGAFANTEEEVGVAKGYVFAMDLTGTR